MFEIPDGVFDKHVNSDAELERVTKLISSWPRINTTEQQTEIEYQQDCMLDWLENNEYSVEELMRFMWAATKNLVSNHKIACVEFDFDNIGDDRFRLSEILCSEYVTSIEHFYGFEFGEAGRPAYQKYTD